MILEEQWDIILKYNHYPCFITDADTHNVLYANDEYIKLLGTSEKVLGKKFYESIPNDYAIDKEDINLDWEKYNIINRHVANKSMNLNFHATLTLLDKYNIVFGILTPTEESKLIMSNFEQAMTRCMEIYAQPYDTIWISFMKLLAEFYDSEYAYIYRYNIDDDTINCIAQYSEDKSHRITKESDIKLSCEGLIDSFENYNDGGVSILDKSTNQEILELTPIIKHTIKNQILSAVYDSDENIVGFVGLSNKNNLTAKIDKRLINTVSRFVAQHVVKAKMDSTLFELHYCDILTGLFNRVGYSRRIEKINKAPNKTMGVISININGLKAINQNASNEAGDNHIKNSAHRIKKHFGYDVFRISGDEFIILAPDVDETEFLNKVNELYKQMREEKNFDFSMGHSFSDSSYSICQLVLEADTIMYINKQEYYQKSERKFDSVGDSVLSDLLSYLENDEFMIYLQPQVKLSDGSLYGAEALIRRFDKTNQKMVFPDQFISLYERQSIIRHVDIFVLEQVCELLAKWLELGKSIPISVNLSRVTLQEYGIVHTIVDICDRYKVPHHLVVIEVTERVGLIDNNVASSLIKGFKDNGFNISLDDFGCAYSNIVTLAQIRVDEVKIDKSLVDDLTTNKNNHILVKNVLTMCNELEGASTLAEGIEDIKQAQLLHELGCHLGQGYYYSRPIPVPEFEEKYIY